VQNPIPAWVDLQPFFNALKAGRCAGSEELPTGFLANLEAAIAERAKDRAAATSK
jgi:hypothetical protein